MENISEQTTGQEQRPSDGAFTLKSGITTFRFNLFFSAVSQDRIEDKIRNLLTREVLSEKALA